MMRLGQTSFFKILIILSKISKGGLFVRMFTFSMHHNISTIKKFKETFFSKYSAL